MLSSAELRFILTQAIERKPDTARVSLQAELLIQGIGADLAAELLGRTLDPDQIIQANESAVVHRTAELRTEHARLSSLAKAGFASAIGKLEKVSKLLTAAKQGRLKSQRIVTVNVGQLRAALLSADTPSL